MEILKLTISPDYTGVDRETVKADFECFLGCNCKKIPKFLCGAGFIKIEGRCLLIDKFMDSDIREKYFYVTKQPQPEKVIYKIQYFQNDIPLSITIDGWVWSLAWWGRLL